MNVIIVCLQEEDDSKQQKAARAAKAARKAKRKQQKGGVSHGAAAAEAEEQENVVPNPGGGIAPVRAHPAPKANPEPQQGPAVPSEAQLSATSPAESTAAEAQHADTAWQLCPLSKVRA